MKINFANRLNILNRINFNNNCLKLNILKKDTVSFSSKNLYGADYGDLDVKKIKQLLT